MNSRLSDKAEWINDLEDRIMETTKPVQEKEKQMLNNENDLRDLCKNIKHTNICIIGLPQWLLPHHNPQSELSEHPGPAHSMSQTK